MKHQYSSLRQRSTRNTFSLCLLITGCVMLWTMTAYSLSVDRSYLMSANGQYIDLPANADDDTRVLIAKAKPREMNVVAVEQAKDGEIQTSIKMCFEDGTGCSDIKDLK